jgi:hypothetical protein
MNVFVTNRGDTQLAVGPYEFKKNNPVELPLEVAVQLFGYGLADREHILVRWGWIQLHSELKEGLKKLDQFEITTERPGKNSSLPSAVVRVPLRLEKGAGEKTQRVA